MARSNRKFSDLKRRKGARPLYDRILIVCEGEKTEPQYFNDIRREYRLPSTFIRVLHSEEGTQPRQIVDFAEEKFSETREFDRVYAVFDRDQHLTYADAIARAEQLNGKLRNDAKQNVVFEAAVSVPCFELWLLLHFENIQAYFHRHEIQTKLRQHITHYDKGMNGVYELTKPNLAVASDRGTRLKSRFARLPGIEAYTDIQDIVRVLKSLLDIKIS